MKIKNILQFTVLLCGLCIGFCALNVKAQADKYKNQRIPIINNAFRHVYGREADAQEEAYWLSVWSGQIDAYGDIVSVETKKLNADPILRGLMIAKAFEVSFGRPPQSADYKKWKPRAEVFAETVELNRQFLYSSDGAKELTKTISRCLVDANGKEPTEDEIKKLLALAVDRKWLYYQMAAYKKVK